MRLLVGVASGDWQGVVARRISRAKFGLYQPDHAVFLEERAEFGRPAPSMRFRTATPMAASPEVAGQ